MYTGWGTSEMVAHAVQAEFKRLGLDVEHLDAMFGGTYLEHHPS